MIRVLRTICSANVVQSVFKSSSLDSFQSNRITIRNIGLYDYNVTSAGTMADIKQKIMHRLGLEHGYVPIPKSREHLLKYEPKHEDLPPRSMKDSFTSAIIPLSTDRHLQDKYVSLIGHVRMGRLMEDMDLFAVWICHQHLHIPNLPEDVPVPYTFVTILVDKVTFSNVVTNATEDIRLSGHVSWVGRSSIEVVVWLEQRQNEELKIITRALFLMAARNATNTRAAPVNPIEPATEEEQKIYDGGQHRKQRRYEIQANSIFKVEPNDYEQFLMYEIYKRTTHTSTMELNARILPANCRWMSETSVLNISAAFPEHRNAHNKVFGGFLMRKAVEISWIAAYLYSRNRPRLEHICDISFEHPVHVASFIKMNAYVVFTEVNYIQIMTVVDILDAVSQEQTTSNQFYSTFSTQDRVPEVLPRSYHETMWYIQGRRKFLYSMGLDGPTDI